MLSFLSWYLVLTLFALAALPLGWTWLRWLPDRGWGLLRPLGLLLASFAVWFAASFGLLRLDAGSGLGGLALLFGVGAWALHRWGGGWAALRAWLRDHRWLVLAEEALFLFAFALWTWYRIHDVEGIQNTERPMDFALFNAIRRGGEVPPNDPWLSGFAISYYYFGYFIMAQVAALAHIASGIAYNLAVATLAATASLGIFSLAYNLLEGAKEALRLGRRTVVAMALLGPLLLVGISNLTGIFNVAFRDGLWPDNLFRQLAVHDFSFNPATGERVQSAWWWWAASRTVSDTAPDGGRLEIIDEFPFFSFMLGDMHPHVLSLPFVLLGVGVALNGLRGALAHRQTLRWRGLLLPPEAWGQDATFGLLALGLTAAIVGGMGMMNTWDLPTLGTLVVGVWLVAALVSGEGRRALGGWLLASVALGLGAFLLYLPFYVGFRSQAGGLRFSPYATQPQHYLLMFGLFLLVLVPLALSQLRDVAGALRATSRRVGAVALAMLALDGVALALLFRAPLSDGPLALAMAGLWLLIPLSLVSLLDGEDATPLAIAQVAGLPLLAGLVGQRWTMVGAAALLGLTLLALWSKGRRLEIGDWRLTADEEESAVPTLRPAIAGGSQEAQLSDFAVHPTSHIPHPTSQASLLFALALAALALLLTMGSEIFYILDGFGTRINTIFKLYYQAWTFMALATVFGLAYGARRLPVALRVPWLALFAALLVGSLWYPIEAVQSKANLGGPANWDGRFWMQQFEPDRFAAVQWLDALPGQVTVLEAPGVSYQPNTSALAGWTGHSTLVGWTGHEVQWRGTGDELARREPIIQQIYQTQDPDEARRLLDEWNIDFVAVTPLEVAKYQLSAPQIDKFRQVMTPVFQQGDVTLFGR